MANLREELGRQAARPNPNPNPNPNPHLNPHPNPLPNQGRRRASDANPIPHPYPNPTTDHHPNTSPSPGPSQAAHERRAAEARASVAETTISDLERQVSPSPNPSPNPSPDPSPDPDTSPRAIPDRGPITSPSPTPTAARDQLQRERAARLASEQQAIDAAQRAQVEQATMLEGLKAQLDELGAHRTLTLTPTLSLTLALP